MSATLIHHGHIRLIKNAKRYGDVIIGLTTDQQIRKFKGYYPEIAFKFRKEILSEIKGVKKVAPSDWLITQKYLDKSQNVFFIFGSEVILKNNSKDLLLRHLSERGFKEKIII